MKHTTPGTFWLWFIQFRTGGGKMVSSFVDLASPKHGGRRWCLRIMHIPFEEIDDCVVQNSYLFLHHGL
jgi:hypothetical protein